MNTDDTDRPFVCVLRKERHWSYIICHIPSLILIQRDLLLGAQASPPARSLLTPDGDLLIREARLN
jgi:hypothetical protein